MFSATVKLFIKLNCWKTKPTTLFLILEISSSVSFAMFLPSKIISPLVGLSRRPMICINVDLPDPDEPIMPMNSPCFISSVVLSSALRVVSPILYSLMTFLRLIIYFLALMNIADYFDHTISFYSGFNVNFFFVCSRQQIFAAFVLVNVKDNICRLAECYFRNICLIGCD